MPSPKIPSHLSYPEQFHTRAPKKSSMIPESRTGTAWLRDLAETTYSYEHPPQMVLPWFQ